jgi:hypothetical protein
MAILIVFIIFVLFDVAVWLWGVDSRLMGRDPRTEGRPKRWI